MYVYREMLHISRRATPQIVSVNNQRATSCEMLFVFQKIEQGNNYSADNADYNARVTYRRHLRYIFSATTGDESV